MHKVRKKHQNTVYWVDIKYAQQTGLKFYQTRLNVIILHETLVFGRKLEKSQTRKCMRYLRLLKDFLETWLDERIGFRSCSTTRWRIFNNLKVPNQTNQIPSPDHDRTVKPVVCRDTSLAKVEKRSKQNLFMKKLLNMIERWHPLLAWHKQITSKQCWTRRIATFSCETNSELSCSRIGQEDREPPSPTISWTTVRDRP